MKVGFGNTTTKSTRMIVLTRPMELSTGAISRLAQTAKSLTSRYSLRSSKVLDQASKMRAWLRYPVPLSNTNSLSSVEVDSSPAASVDKGKEIAASPTAGNGTTEIGHVYCYAGVRNRYSPKKQCFALKDGKFIEVVGYQWNTPGLQE